MLNIIIMKKLSIILAFLTLGIIPVLAQGEECAFTLREAENLYSQGRIENIPTMLEACIQSGFSSEDRLAAFKLIILCSLYNDEQEQAEGQMLDFLKKYPEYELTPTDPEEFGYLFQNYRTRPIFDYGLFVGLNSTHGSLLEPYSLFPNLGDDELRFRPDGFGLGAGLVLNFYVTNSIQISVTPMYAQKKIRLDHYDDVVLETYNKEHFERQSYLDIPLSVTYDFDLGRFKPFLRVGGQFGYLFEAKTSTTTIYLHSDGKKLYENSGPDEDVYTAGNRNKINYSILAGAGVKLKIPKGYFYLDASYTIGLNLQNTGNRFEVDELTWKYQYIDPDFRVNSVMVGVGFVRSFFNPKRID